MLGLLAALLPSPALAGDKKSLAPPQTWPASRTFAASCDSLWPAALQVTTGEGWAVKTSDRAGGILALEWTRGQITGNSSVINPLVGQHTTEKSTGFWTLYTGFRIAGAQMTAFPEGSGCQVSFSVSYHGYEIRKGRSDWWILHSNGWFENKMLDEMEVKVTGK